MTLSPYSPVYPNQTTAEAVVSHKRIGNVVLILTHHRNSAAKAELFAGILSPLNVEPYIHMRRIILSASEPSHSHPLLTIHESHITPELLPAVFLHEQMHWRLTLSKETPEILSSLGRKFAAYPDLDPVHLAVCRLEVRALTAVLGSEVVHNMIGQVQRYMDEYIIALFAGELIDACLCGLSPSEMT